MARKRGLKMVAACFVLAVGIPAPAAAAPPAPTSRAVSKVLDDHFSKLIGVGEPGCVEGVSRGGKVIASRTQGFANLELDVPMAVDMAFDIGSASKQFTAASIALLARRGKLDLDADIRTYLPDMAKMDAPITVRHLVHHSSGLPDVYESLKWQYGDEDANKYPSDLTLRLARGITKANFKPGSKFEYSNVGYLLLGEIVARVSGLSLRNFAQANLFGPMGMTRTHFHDDYKEIVPRRASAYSLKDDGKTWEWRHSDFDIMGDGGVFSTLGDLAKWYSVYSDPSRLEGGKALVDMLLTPGVYTEEQPQYLGRPMQYGFGVQMFGEGDKRMIGHPGGWAGYGTIPYYYPTQDFAVIVLCNFRKAELLKAALKAGAELSGTD